MNEILQNLVILQDLDEMIAEAEDTDILDQQEKMGFEIKGVERLKEARKESDTDKEIALMKQKAEYTEINLKKDIENLKDELNEKFEHVNERIDDIIKLLGEIKSNGKTG